MWLLNTSTHELSEFYGVNIPPYAILSHTWGQADDEVSFHDIQNPNSAVKCKPGYDKVKNCCARAEKDGHGWAWIDSCCIDKRSSAELSEAINSMYTWYQNAQICYVYLFDVPSTASGASAEIVDVKLSGSRWFTRGWTLQELIAPRNIQFLAQDWTFIGSSNSSSGNSAANAIFLAKLAEISGVRVDVLQDSSILRRTSISQRMSWAAKRKTTRSEDTAYALMGLFGVSMPILYGEGQRKAFQRLQLEIIKSNPDHTIFAWRSDKDKQSSGLLADSPLEFAESGAFQAYNPWQTTVRPHSMTNLGMSINLPLLFVTDDIWGSQVLAALRCWVGPKNDSRRIRIYLTRVTRKSYAGSVQSIYRRVRCNEFEYAGGPAFYFGERQEIYVLEEDQFDYIQLIDDWSSEAYQGEV